MNSATTMRLAQTLYENGYITYMRTDSPALSGQAVAAARKQATSLYGAEYVPAKPRVYSAKSDSAQEAHEAIRPAGDSFRTPDQVRAELRADQFRLYELIWKRTVASQMADAVGSTSTLRLGAVAGGYDGEFAASGTVITFRGFLAAYEEGRDETDPQDDEVRLPALASGDSVRVDELTVEDHATNPPARYTEASLIRALEERGIGRPSTYAATISVIVDRGYVYHRGQALVPSWLAFAVTQLLEKHFEWLVDYEFTAEMESDLDEIAAGDQDRVDWLTRFYFGDGTGHPGGEGLQDLVANLGDIDAREVNSVTVRDGTVVRVGRYGPYLEEPSDEEDGTPRRVSIPDTIAPDELTPAVVVELLTAKPDEDIVLGQDPDTGTTIVAKDGRYGPYVTEVFEEEKKKPRTASLLKSMSLSTVTLADALQLLSLPRLVGTDPNTGEDITAQNGRYGPYLKRGTDSRSLQTEESIFTITLDEALALYAQPKTRRGRAAAAPLRELGTDPATGKPVVVKDGRYGPYVTDGETNATLRKMDSVENVTLDRAAELLAEKRAKPPTKRTARRSTKKTGKTATGKTTTGKTTTGKTTTGKTTTKRTSAGKKTSQQKASE
jgi:DNA topoisomerase-1